MGYYKPELPEIIKHVVCADSKFQLFDDLVLESLALRNCHHCIITKCAIEKIEIINSQDNLIIGCLVKNLREFNEVPEIKGLFKKRKTKKWLKNHGSRNNYFSWNTIMEGNIEPQEKLPDNKVKD